MTQFRRVLMASAAVTTLATTPWGAASAEEEESGSASSLQLEQVTVTATKRAERLQDVPVSVTALTSSVLERNNVRELGDLVKLAPGLVITYGSQPGNFAISMRGIGTFSSGIAVESDVAIVIDDVPMAQQAQAFQDLVDVDRIEVLRGPQSTLFGKSAIAGVLNITTATPTHELTGKAYAYGTNDDEKRGGLTLSGPVSDTLRFRLTVDDSDYKGNVINIYNGQKVDGSSGLTVSGKLEWTPTDNLLVSLAPRFNRNQSTCCVGPLTSLTPGLYYQGIAQPSEAESVVLRGIPIGQTNHYIDMDYRPGGGDSRDYGATAHVEYHFADDSFMHGHTLASISSDDHWRMFDYQDQDGNASHFLLYYPLTAPSGIDSGAYQYGFFHADSVTQEFRLTSPDTGRIKYVTGLWYAENNLNRWLWKGPVLNSVEYMAVSGNTNYSAYGNATLDITDKLSLVGGLRHNLQKIDYTFINYFKTLHYGDHNQEWSSTGKGGIEYKWTPDIMTFATYSTGYKGQAYDLVSTFNAKEEAQMPVPHETAKNYEVGLKTSLFDRRVYFDLTLFDANYHGFQTSVTSTLPDGTFLTYLQSIGQLKTRGVEVDAAAKATANFTLNGSFAYTQATVVRFPNGPCYTGQVVLPGTPAQGCYLDNTNSKVQNLAGKPLNNVPKAKGDIGGEYDHPLGGLPFGGFVSFDWRYQSKVNFTLSQDPRTIQGGYGIGNFSVGVNDNHDHYKLQLFVENAFNKPYATGLSDGTAGFSIPGVSGSGVGTGWTIPRDAFRYFGGRVDVQF
jgi:iron complex outermembrane receptor protein